MENTSYIALSRLGGLRRQMEIVANNVANMNSSGFKGEKMMFVEHLVRSKGGEKILGDKLHFVRDVATVRDTTEGPISQTNNPFDLAIAGEGYFAVQTPEGPRYTRNGRFQLDQTGQLVNQDGFAVMTQGGGPLVFGPRDINVTIGRDGSVSSDTGPIGKLQVVRFENEQDLKRVAGGLYRTDQQPQAVRQGSVIQGAVENSNVQPIIELTRMIEVQRAYESLSKFIDREDDRIRTMAREMTRAA